MPSVSKKQQKFMGIVRAIQKGEADPSDFNKDAQDAAKKMKKSSVKKYAKTKHKGLPTKKVSESLTPAEIKKERELKISNPLKLKFINNLFKIGYPRNSKINKIKYDKNITFAFQKITC